MSSGGVSVTRGESPMYSQSAMREPYGFPTQGAGKILRKIRRITTGFRVALTSFSVFVRTNTLLARPFRDLLRHTPLYIPTG